MKHSKIKKLSPRLISLQSELLPLSRCPLLFFNQPSKNFQIKRIFPERKNSFVSLSKYKYSFFLLFQNTNIPFPSLFSASRKSNASEKSPPFFKHPKIKRLLPRFLFKIQIILCTFSVFIFSKTILTGKILFSPKSYKIKKLSPACSPAVRPFFFRISSFSLFLSLTSKNFQTNRIF